MLLKILKKMDTQYPVKTIISFVVSINYSSAESKYSNIYNLNYFPLSTMLEMHILAKWEVKK